MSAQQGLAVRFKDTAWDRVGQGLKAVRDVLVRSGVKAHSIEAAGRGEREPAVPTADEVAETRNRRVEIQIR